MMNGRWEEEAHSVRKTFLMAMLLLAGCDVPGISACEQALKDRLNNPESFERIEIREEYGQGKATSVYIISYRFKDYLQKHRSQSMRCTYGNDSKRVYLRDLGSLN